MTASDSIPVDEKRQALDRVLTSRTFSRSERLRAFLRYVCEAEFEGRAEQINEYALGVSALGRPPDYSPAEDSSVRSRAYELRNKLRTYYESEAANDPLQIEIDKGGYVPRFVRREKATPAPAPPPPPAPAPEAAAEAPAAAPVSIPAPPEPPAATERRFAALPWAAVALLVAVVGVLSLLLVRNQERATTRPRAPLATRELEALWKPFLDSDAPLLIAFETRLFFFAPPTGLVVRDYQTNEPADAARSAPLAAFRERMGVQELQDRFDYADVGAVHAAFLLGRLLGRDIGLKHSNSLGWQDIWNSNVIFLGKPNLNPTIRYSLEGKDFVETAYGAGIRNLHPLPGEPELYRMATTHGAGEKYGLITVLPGPQAGRRMMILSSSGAEFTWALAEAVTSPARVQEIMSHVIPPSGECPPAFQVVISATFESNVPVKIRYVTHRVSKTP
jgi:hypothetical protein